MANLALINELNTNGSSGHKQPLDKLGTQQDNLLELTMQRRATNPSGGIYQWWLGQHYDGSEIAPWWSPQRDWDLRLFWQREGNDILQGALASMLKWGRTLAWVVEGPQRVAKKYQQTLAESEFGDGWGTLISKVLLDYYTQDKGASIEIIGDGPADGPLVGPVLGLAHLDSQYVQPTGDPVYPILFNNAKTGHAHKIHTTRVIRLVDMPSPSEYMCGVGFCALSRIIAASQVLLKLTRYKNEKLSDMPEAGLLILNNILPKQWDDAQANHARGRRKLGEEIWSPIMTLFSIDPAQPATATLTSFASLPEGFDEDVVTRIYVNIVALAFGVDAREFWPVSSGSLGTVRETETMAEKAKGKGKGDVISIIERALNWKVLPESVSFRFDSQDDEQDKTRAEINEKKVNTIMAMWQPDQTANGIEPPITALELRQMLADNVPDYFKPEFLQVDITDEGELSDTEREDKALGLRVAYDDKGRRLGRGYKAVDRVLGMVEDNYKAGRISLDEVIEFRLGRLLDERANV